ncbi:MAG: cob(I)yrinic acid a,c-diamide adenosyltransferase [Bacteroidetes bacterium]|jgi:cob(I)alamin adenosyltransferase|nr:cob(I)yrinic acid a,c-diamide adenosyltransferase [Bacteroidota bacterium]
MKIYTKTGDAGSSSLLGGSRVSKADPRLEAYGTLDELNAWIGLLKEQHALQGHSAFLSEIQEELFTMGSHLAAEDQTQVEVWKLPALSIRLVGRLEAEMDRMDSGLEPLRNFILSGGHPASAMAQVVRTVCRRAERAVVSLTLIVPEQASRLQAVLITLNRLSDYFFVLARDILRSQGVEAHVWNPRTGQH